MKKKNDIKKTRMNENKKGNERKIEKDKRMRWEAWKNMWKREEWEKTKQKENNEEKNEKETKKKRKEMRWEVNEKKNNWRSLHVIRWVTDNDVVEWVI